MEVHLPHISCDVRLPFHFNLPTIYRPASNGIECPIHLGINLVILCTYSYLSQEARSTVILSFLFDLPFCHASLTFLGLPKDPADCFFAYISPLTDTQSHTREMLKCPRFSYSSSAILSRKYLSVPPLKLNYTGGFDSRMK